MTTPFTPIELKNTDIYSTIVAAIGKDGFFIADNVFSQQQLKILLDDVKSIDGDKFHRAGIGRDAKEHTNDDIRRDKILWLERDRSNISFYWEWMEQLRLIVNRELYLGLFEYECHYAHYDAGAYYKKHVDAFKGAASRKLSTVLYLNSNWLSADGGELVLYEENGNDIIRSIAPTLGTLVIFLSEIFPHEVKPARRSRRSLTGWFRINNTTSQFLDPGR